MINALGLLKQRRFLPLFTTQFLGAFNDNLFKTSMVLFATYSIFQDPAVESNFNALATGISTLPFFLLSALSGQLADTSDKARIIRIVKIAEVAIMLVGAAGLLAARSGRTNLGIGLMLGAVLLLGVHSTFFGPIKYAILPQHLRSDQVLGGTGLVEAGTYLAILSGTVVAGLLARYSFWWTIGATMTVALVGLYTATRVPPAPRLGPKLKLDYNPFTASWTLIRDTMHIRRLFLAICAISFFWTIGAVLIIVFPPLVKNVLTADERVASATIAIFSIGVALGSVVINTMLKSDISARHSPASVIGMGVLVAVFSLLARRWTGAPAGELYGWAEFLAQPLAVPILVVLLLIATTGGMFVVPLYAFLTTTVEADQTARTVAANNVVNSGAMTVGSLIVIGLVSGVKVSPENMLLVVSAMCVVAAWLAVKLNRACHGGDQAMNP
jgi:hypothetical protein